MADLSTGVPQPAADPPYQSLYRRFRPQRFSEVKGQDHVTRALRNSVRDGRVAHAYLFSGPRGTGKTSTARILAMALNCAHPVDGEPDGICDSCVDIRRGSSVDVQELDAASNRRIDEMRDLLSRVALGTRGRWKVYIIDEVHQLTSDAASALLKTLEEPPAHVVFVLATTDPQKVLPTIRSRTIHFDFHLLPAEVLGDLLREVNDHAHLGVPAEAIDLVVRRGHGSARDALTVLDQVAAGGMGEDPAHVVSQIVDALAERDAGLALAAVAEGMAAGRDARRLAADLLDHLRNAFLATLARSLVMLPDDTVTELAEQARRLGLAALVRAMEVIGQALTDMRDSVDPRMTLEVALVRLARPDADVSPAALLERIERLERAARSTDPTALLRAGERASPAPPLGSHPAAHPTAHPIPQPPAAARSALPPPPPVPGSRATTPGSAPVAWPPSAPARPEAAPARPGSAPVSGSAAAPPDPPSAAPQASHPALPTRDELTKAWGDGVLAALSARAKGYLGSGRFVQVDPDGAVFALPTQQVVANSRDLRPEAEAALAARFGRRIPLKLVLEPGVTKADGVPPQPEPEEVLGREDLEDLQDADAAVISPEQRLLDVFPGAEEVST
ncbi:MAG TPA: DNA polymerase III subunit gamma/tau [Acidimicrobiales bacterium]|jgi:DNA polymerase-3 subunit gamma/tau|nr:DNA polymerase III subunit gamma/tau [Acidimicrobiales bacterium]